MTEKTSPLKLFENYIKSRKRQRLAPGLSIILVHREALCASFFCTAASKDTKQKIGRGLKHVKTFHGDNFSQSVYAPENFLGLIFLFSESQNHRV